MLTGSSLGTCAPICKDELLRAGKGLAGVLLILLNISKGSLFSDSCYCSGLKDILLSKYLAHELMRNRLIFAGEVEVDIRLLVPVKAQERRKRNVESVLVHRGTTSDTYLVRHIKTGVVHIQFLCKLQLVTLRADIMRL